MCYLLYSSFIYTEKTETEFFLVSYFRKESEQLKIFLVRTLSRVLKLPTPFLQPKSVKWDKNLITMAPYCALTNFISPFQLYIRQKDSTLKS